MIESVEFEHTRARVRCLNPGCNANTTELVLRRAVRPDGDFDAFEFEFRYCSACRVGFVHPFPSPEVLGALYRTDYPYHATSAETSIGRYAWKIRLASLLYPRHPSGRGRNRTLAALQVRLAAGIETFTRRSASYSLTVPPSLPPDARILDFGFGTGTWLLAMRRLGHRELYGYDITKNEENVRRLAANDIHASSRPPAQAFPGVRFDCIRLEHVFEHLPDPIGELRRLRQILRPDGRLVMTFPSIYSWEPVQELPASPHLAHLQLPIHLLHHSVDSARGFLEAGGYEVQDIRILRPFPLLSVLAHPSG